MAFDKVIDRSEVDRCILTDRRVRTASGFDPDDPIRQGVPTLDY